MNKASRKQHKSTMSDKLKQS